MAKKKDLKKFRGGIRLESTSEPTDLAGDSTDAGIMYYDSDSESIKVHNGSGFSAVGGGSGGGLDTFYTEDFTTQVLADGNTGTDKFVRTVTGTGGKTAISFTSDADEISERSLKITLGDDTDSLTSPAIVLKKRQQGQTCSISFYYKTDTFVDDDMKLEVLSGTSIGAISTSLVSENIKASTTIKKFVTTFTIPSDATHLQYKFINKSTSGTKLIYVDDVEMSQDPFVQADLGTITEWETFTPVGSYTNNVTYTGKKRRIGDTMEYQVRMTFAGAGTSDTGDIEIGTSAGSFLGDGLIDTSKMATLEQFHMPLGSFIFESTVESPAVALHGDVVYSTANTVKLRVFQASDSVGTYVNGDTVEHNIPEVPSGDDNTEIHCNFKVPIVGLGSTNTHIITPAKSNLTDWVSYTPSGSWGGDVTYQGKYRRVGDSIEIEAQLRLSGGTVTGGDLTFTSAQLLNGLGITADTAKLINDAGELEALGSGLYEDQGTGQRGGLTLFYQSTGAIFSLAGSSFSNLTSGGSPITWASGDSISFKATIPIEEWSAQDSNWLAALPMTKWQEKKLDQDFSTSSTPGGNDSDIEALSFTGLDSTKTYKLTVTLKVVATSAGAGVYVRDAASGGGNVLHTFRPFKHTDTITIDSSSYNIATDQHEVVGGTIMATGVTSLYLHVFEFNSTDVVHGGTADDDKQSKVLLEELPMHTEVDTW